MTVVRKFYPNVRLKSMVGGPDGVRCEELIDRATENLEEIRDNCLAGIDNLIERIHALVQSWDQSRLEDCHVLANEIFALAGTLSLDELSKAAYSLCSLLDSFERKAIPVAAIRVHVDTMRALRRREIASNRHLRTATLAELTSLVQRLTGKTRDV